MQRCSSEARVRDCPPHRPEEQWLCCFARLQRDIPKVPTLNRKKEQSTICLTHAPGIPRHRGYNKFFYWIESRGKAYSVRAQLSPPP
ncbi:hypothetical protein AAG906_019275 [Vitis piasezkii]|uniref:ORF86 n=2 Tax=Vitis TaxID=3603 RepID=B6VJY4_VITVI|nr:orf86 [Vitis vinifera]ACS15212.1 ORF86 [Vitis vinifera]CAQ77655.1 orf86 [Vitis vinifera]VZL70120.1 orf86 [Vitis riparia x Vitis cinerea]|eukprot:YP_002608396.1 orf86 (mitochondrion) [Vitis vinifera]